jgi:hypothetical protein
MKACVHIAYYFKEKRLSYLDKMLKEYCQFPCEVDIYIHTNVELSDERWSFYENGKVNIVVHDFSNDDPMFLTWKCRELLPSQIDAYDIFMYAEDDVFVPKEAFQYWLENKDIAIAENYNLGFFRIQVDKTVEDEYISDAQEAWFDRNIVQIGEKKFLVNKFSYCAFWVYDKNEMLKFLNSSWFSLDSVKKNYNSQMYTVGIREVSAWGLHLKHPYFPVAINHYKDTVFLLDENEKLDKGCRVYHIDEVYHHNPGGSFIVAKFSDCIKR